jgi:hypothetical protein
VSTVRRALVVTALLATGAAALAGATPPELGAFSRAGGKLPADWEPLEFPKIPSHTRYELVQNDGTWVVRADSRDAASGLIRSLDLDLREAPVLRWRWKVERVVEKSDIARKDGDDYAARVYVMFKYDPERVGFVKKSKYLLARAIYGEVPIASLVYVWANQAERGKIFDNPYTGDFVKMVVVENAAEHVGSWRSEQRDVLADYRAAFGEEPPRVEGIAIMTDTDDTGESAVAYYGDLELVPDPPPTLSPKR